MILVLERPELFGCSPNLNFFWLIDQPPDTYPLRNKGFDKALLRETNG